MFISAAMITINPQSVQYLGLNKHNTSTYLFVLRYWWDLIIYDTSQFVKQI